jgi:large subunit ribosomal protein L5
MSLQKKYQEEVVKKMMEKYKYRNKLAVPKITKVVLNMGVGDAKQDIKMLNNAMEELAAISGQKPVITRAKKSIAGFNLKAGMAIGCKVTLRGKRMYDFLARLINIALPRIRDFKGIKESCFDEQGNCTIGLKEQIIFPEVDYEKVTRVRGLNVCITTTAKRREEGKELLTLLGFPFRK